ncbi:hypothetical protein [Thalassomonas actiniarum]|uniref:Uncharacterized protein n=1 Tax=Thalassomonas actiniarum TaxID=485447 RepID=A0AAF0C2T1_9GAMM|nr:hypothetical protein [Thalassomonas actiniarum]WDD98857.1 hypothetical protein SG35_027130 [Thalassomonas actiniarum]
MNGIIQLLNQTLIGLILPQLQYNFAVGVLTVLPAARLTTIVTKGLQVSLGQMAGHLIAGGVTNVIIGEFFPGQQSESLVIFFFNSSASIRHYFLYRKK